MNFVNLLEHSSDKYSPRTYYNAKKADLTLALAVDFNTAGEKCTHKAAGDKYLALDYNKPWLDNARLLYKELNKRQVKILNIAGNGIYTFSQYGYKQQDINLYLYNMLSQVNKFYQVGLIISGGQTGVDFAAGVVSEVLGIPCEMTLPKGYIQRYEDKRDFAYGYYVVLNELLDAVNELRGAIEPPILQFQGETRWLSNFALCNVWLDGVLYPSTENAYQAAKTQSYEERFYFIDCTPAQAKKQGRSITMRPTWDDIKIGVMEDLTRQKFKQEPYKSQLLATGNCQLVEGNKWGDTFWGVCNGVGQNNLGKIIMKVRGEINDNNSN